jgi:hypothetical protein
MVWAAGKPLPTTGFTHKPTRGIRVDRPAEPVLPSRKFRPVLLKIKPLGRKNFDTVEIDIFLRVWIK